MDDRPPTRQARTAAVARVSAARAGLGVRWLGAALIATAALVLAGQQLRAQTGTGEERIIVSHGFSDLGELKYGPDFEHLDYVNPDAPKGGEMSTWARGTFDSMNPYTRQGRAHGFSILPYERLMTSTADDPYGAYCLLCETLEYPESQDWVIFNLRPEARFSDGSPVTAEDVAFTFRLFLEQGLPSFSSAVKNLIPEVEVLGEHRVKFIFNPDVPRKGLIGQAGSAIVFQKKWYEDTGARLDESRLTQSPGSGPYVIDEVEVNRRITVRRDPDYWGADLPINIGRNNFDRLRVEFFADSNAALEGFTAGAYTFRQETSSLTWATQYDFPAIGRGDIVKTELPNGNLPAATGFVFNLRKEKFQDIRVRQALGLMFNFTWTNDTLQYGLFQQRASFWENSPLAATGLPEGRELELLQSLGDAVDPAVLTTEAPMPDPGGPRQLNRDNLERAAALLREAGWTEQPPPPLPPVLGVYGALGLSAVFLILGGVAVMKAPRRNARLGGAGASIIAAAASFYFLGTERPADPDGLLRQNGQTLRVELLESNPSFDRIFIPYIDNLKRLGVVARYNRIDDAQYTARNRDGDFDMIYDFFNNGLEEGLGLSQRFGCADALNSVFNPAAYCDPAVDSLIERVIEAESLEDMQAGVRAIDRIMRHAYFMVPTWYNDKHWVAYYDMFEHPEELPPYALGNLDFWWYNAEKADRLRASGAL